MYFAPPEGEAIPAGITPGAVVREEVPLTMLAPMLILAVGVILLGLFNGEIVSQFIDPSIPERLAR